MASITSYTKPYIDALLGTQWVNVERYGASNANTAAQNQTALTAAISSLTDGSTLYFPPGAVYQLTDTLTISGLKNLTVIADGATLVGNGSTDSSAVLIVSNIYHGTIRGFTLQHGSTGARRNAADGLTVLHCTDLYITGIKVNYVYSIGIRLAGSARTTVTACVINGSVADGIGAYGSSRYSSADGTMTSGSAVITSATAKWTEGDIGAQIQVPAGASNAAVALTLVSVQSSTQATLSAASQSTFSATTVRITRVCKFITIIGNHLPLTGDDSISSVGYLVYDTVSVGPNTDIAVIGNHVKNSGSRGICFVGVWGGVIADNIVEGAQQANVYLSTEPNVGGSWGTRDVNVHDNILTNGNLGYGTGNSNYGAISVDSIFQAYPVENINIHHNTIRSPQSYYLRAGGDGGQSDFLSTKKIRFENNLCVGGNANNPGVLIIKASDVTVSGGLIENARTSAVQAYNTAGVIVVRDVTINAYDQAAGGSPALDVPGSTIQLNNIINGTLTTTASTTVPAGLKTGTPPGGVTSGLLLWLEAENTTTFTDGQQIASMTDGSGAGRNAVQATSSAQPLYRSTAASVALPNGKPVMFFDGSDDYLASPLPVTSAPMTLIVVLRDPNPGSGYRPYFDLAAAGAGGTRLILNNNGSTTFTISGTNAATTTQIIPTATYFLATVILAADGSATFFYNGTQVAVTGNPGTVGTHATQPGYIMNRYSDGSPAGLGIVRAIDLVYNRAITATERGNIETALKTKYGIS